MTQVTGGGVSRTSDRMEDVISRITQSQSPEPVVVGHSIWLIKQARLFFFMGCHRHHASRARWTDLLLHFVRHSSCKTQATHNTLSEKGEKGIDRRGFNCLCRRRSFFFPSTAQFCL